MATYTKGPWNYIDAPGYNTIEGNNETIAVIPNADYFRANIKTEEGQANIKLIAAAPEMLEALVECLSCIDQHTEDPVIGPIIKHTQKVIAKAKGGL